MLYNHPMLVVGTPILAAPASLCVKIQISLHKEQCHKIGYPLVLVTLTVLIVKRYLLCSNYPVVQRQAVDDICM